MDAITREEKILSGESLTPITREEMFLAKAAGQAVSTPKPITRKEMFLSRIQGGSGGVQITDDNNGNVVITVANSDTSIIDDGVGNVVIE